MNDVGIKTTSPELLIPETKGQEDPQPLLEALERAADEITSFQLQQTSNEQERLSLNKANSEALLPHVASLSALLRKIDSLNDDTIPEHVELDDFPDLIKLSDPEDTEKHGMDLSDLDKTISQASIFTCALCFGASLHSSLASFNGNMNLVSATYTAGWVAITSFWARSMISLIRNKPRKNQWLTNVAKRSSIFTSVSLGTHAVLSKLFPNVVPPIKLPDTVVQVLCSCFWYFIDQVNKNSKKAIGSDEKNTRDQHSSIQSSLKDYEGKRSTFLSILATEIEDATVMLTATLHYFSPSRILEGSHELLAACSIPVPIASISAINTTTKQVRYLSSHLPLLARLSLAQSDINMEIEKSTVDTEFDIGDMLQAVGDAMAGVASKLGAKLVIYHSDNALHYTNVRGDEDVLRHTLINLVRNLLDSCTAGSCIELGLNVTPLTSDTESSASRLLVTFTMTLELSTSSDSSFLPNANLTSKLLAYLGGSLALENLGDSSNSFIIRLEMNAGNRLEKVPELTEKPHERLHRQLSNIRFSDEPMLEELSTFVNRLSGVKVVLYATDQSVFAKHLTSCLAGWNVNISHVSVVKSSDEDGFFLFNDSEVTTPGSEASAAHSVSLDAVNPRVDITSPQGEQNFKTAPPTFILIDDDVHTLEQQLHEFRTHAALTQAAQASRRHKRGKSNAYTGQTTTAIIHFTSLSEYKKVRDTINWFNAVSILHPYGIPQIIVVPKPAGPRRFLTALHTAWSNAVVEPQYLPIATSPSSPMSHSSQKSIWNGGLVANLSSPSSGSMDESGILNNEGGVHLQRRPGSGIYSPPILPNEEGSNYFTAPGSGSKAASPSGLHAHEVQGSPTGVSTAEGMLFDPSNKSASSSVSSTSGSRSGITRSYRSGSTSMAAHSARRRSNTDLRGGTDFMTPNSGNQISLPVGFHQPPLDQVSPGGSPLKISTTASQESTHGTPSTHPSTPKSTPPADGIVGSEAITPVRSPIDITPPVPPVDIPVAAPIPSVSPANKPIAERSLAISRRRKKERVASSGVSSPPINVLIVEDNVINQAILSTWMKKHKIKFGTASNGQEALDKWSGGGYHLILMDIQLPVMDGIEATKRIRAIEKKQKTGKIPRHAMTDEQLSAFRSPVIIVALTASSLASDREAALSVGCNDFLTKPVDLVWLEKKIIEWGCMQALIDFDSWRKWKRSEGVTEPKAIKAAAAAVLASKTPPSKNVVTEASSSSSSSSSTKPVSPTPSKSSEAPSARKGVLLPGASGLKRRSSTAAEENSKNGGGSSRRPLTRSNSEPHIQVHEQQPPPPSSSNDSHFGTLSPIKEASGSSDGSMKLLSELATTEMQ